MSFSEESIQNQFSTSQKDTNRKNMEILKKDILNPIVEHVISELYPYIFKFVLGSIFIFVLLLVLIFLNLRIIYK